MQSASVSLNPGEGRVAELLELETPNFIEDPEAGQQ